MAGGVNRVEKIGKSEKSQFRRPISATPRIALLNKNREAERALRVYRYIEFFGNGSGREQASSRNALLPFIMCNIFRDPASCTCRGILTMLKGTQPLRMCITLPVPALPAPASVPGPSPQAAAASCLNLPHASMALTGAWLRGGLVL